MFGNKNCGTCECWHVDPKNLSEGICFAGPPSIIVVGNEIAKARPTMHRDEGCYSHQPKTVKLELPA